MAGAGHIIATPAEVTSGTIRNCPSAPRRHRPSPAPHCGEGHLERGADRATIERNLAQVERYLRAASEDIAHQQKTLRNLMQQGEDMTEAMRSIGILEHIHLM
jgi:hypothetical protein